MAGPKTTSGKGKKGTAAPAPGVTNKAGSKAGSKTGNKPGGKTARGK